MSLRSTAPPEVGVSASLFVAQEASATPDGYDLRPSPSEQYGMLYGASTLMRVASTASDMDYSLEATESPPTPMCKESYSGSTSAADHLDRYGSITSDLRINSALQDQDYIPEDYTFDMTPQRERPDKFPFFIISATDQIPDSPVSVIPPPPLTRAVIAELKAYTSPSPIVVDVWTICLLLTGEFRCIRPIIAILQTGHLIHWWIGRCRQYLHVCLR